MKRFGQVLSFFLCFVFPVFSDDGGEIIRVKKLSPRVLVLTENSPMENNVTVIVTTKGLVAVDATGSRLTAELMRKTVQKTLNRNDFSYLILTHHHWDHAFGAQAFSDAVIVGHHGCVDGLQRATDGLSRTRTQFARNLEDVRGRADEAADGLKSEVGFYTRICTGLDGDFALMSPQLTFNDKLMLDMGDLTLHLYYFGSAHSGTDVVIHIPEEGILLTGDVFLDQNWLPLFAGQPRLDIPKWIEVLDTLLTEESGIHTVIPSHQKLWTREKLELWRTYIVDLWNTVNRDHDKHRTLDEVLAAFPLGNEYLYLKKLGHDDEELARFHERNVRAFWRQLFKSAASVLEPLINDSGIEAARQRFQRMKTDESHEFFIDEAEFNVLGYRIMGAGKIRDAIEVFTWNAETFPNSWNVWDSLGEAYLNANETELAIKHYQKSIELNPENENGKQILQRIKQEAQ